MLCRIEILTKDHDEIRDLIGIATPIWENDGIYGGNRIDIDGGRKYYCFNSCHSAIEFKMKSPPRSTGEGECPES